VSRLPEPTRLERWVGEGGWFVDLLLPSTDGGVLGQAFVVVAVFALLYRPARRWQLLQLWVGSFAFVAGLFVLRASH
jgi:hypothetical protein